MELVDIPNGTLVVFDDNEILVEINNVRIWIKPDGKQLLLDVQPSKDMEVIMKFVSANCPLCGN